MLIGGNGGAGTWPLAAAGVENVAGPACLHNTASVLPDSPSSHINPLFDSAMRQQLVNPQPSPTRSLESPRLSASPPMLNKWLNADAVEQSTTSSPEKPTPLDKVMSNSCVLTPEATLAALHDPKVHYPRQSQQPQDTAIVDQKHMLGGGTSTGAQAPQENPPPTAAAPTARQSDDQCFSEPENRQQDGTQMQDCPPDTAEEGTVPVSWCWEVDSSANETIDLSPVDSETRNAYAPDLAEMVRLSKLQPMNEEEPGSGDSGRTRVNLVEEIQPYDGPPLGCEAAEYWGPEWLDDDGGEMDARLSKMTKVNSHPDVQVGL